MIKVLILAYDFPPLNTIGGQRPYYWTKYFLKNRIYPVVVTRKWRDDLTSIYDYSMNDKEGIEVTESKQSLIIRAPYKKSFFETIKIFLKEHKIGVLEKLLFIIEILFRWNIKYFDEKRFIYDAARKYLKEHQVDMIIATGEPFILFQHANLLSKEFGIPWVGDYRDGWTTDITAKNNILYKIMIKYESVFEKKYLKEMIFYTTVSLNISKDISNKFFKKDNHIIENGIDLELFNSIKSSFSDVFKLVYTGTIYPEHDVQSFLLAFEQLINKYHNLKIQVYFIGILMRENNNTDIIKQFQIKYPKHIFIKQTLNREESIKYQKESSILLKFSIRATVKGFYGAKMYEYIACQKPILNIVKQEKYKHTDFFDEKNIQSFAIGKKEIFTYLETYFIKFQENTITIEGLTKLELFKISREYNTSKLADIIIKTK